MEEHNEIPLNINSRLPAEMLEKVFCHLDPNDLKTVMLVCKTWNEVAEASPVLWYWVKIRSLCQLKMKRIQGAREIHLPSFSCQLTEGSPKGIWHKLLQAILQHPGLKKFTWSPWLSNKRDIKLTAAEVDLLTQVFAKMEEITINYSYGYHDDVTRYVIDAVLQGANNLKKLVLNELKWNKSVDMVLLVTTLNKIEVLEVGLNEEQANLLFKLMKDGTSIKSLSLSERLKFSKLEPKLLFGAFDKLKVLLLEKEIEDGDNELLQLDAVTTLCKTVAAGTNLKKLELTDGHLSQVNHHLLGRMATQMATKLEELQLCGYGWNRCIRDQIGTIVEAIATEVVTLKTVGLHYIDFSLVDGHLLARMTTQVKDLQLYSNLDQDQVKAILEAIALAPGKLKKLKTWEALDTVDADVLACAANNLEYFGNNNNDQLSTHQMEKILSRALEATSLKTLILPGDRTLLESNLITEAQKIIPRLSIETDTFYYFSDLDESGSEFESGSDSESAPGSESDSEAGSNSVCDPHHNSDPGNFYSDSDC